jgi:hypothetical protein
VSAATPQAAVAFAATHWRRRWLFLAAFGFFGFFLVFSSGGLMRHAPSKVQRRGSRWGLIDVSASQGAPCSTAHCNSSRCPLCSGHWRVISSHGQWCARRPLQHLQVPALSGACTLVVRSCCCTAVERLTGARCLPPSLSGRNVPTRCGPCGRLFPNKHDWYNHDKSANCPGYVMPAGDEPT